MSDLIVYLSGCYLPKHEAVISPDDRGFLFGDGIYDVIRAVDGRLFETAGHLARLTRNAQDLKLPLPDPEALLTVAQTLLAENGFVEGDAAVYLQVTRGVAPRQHAYPTPPVAPTVYVTAFAFERRRRWHEEGIRVLTVADTRWGRCDIKSVSLLPNVMAVEQAHTAGADEAVFVRDGLVLEGAHSSFFAVVDGTVTTAPLSHAILPGIIRALVLDLTREMGLPVAERALPEADLARAEELFLTGTTTDVAPIVVVDGRTVGTGRPGPVTLQLQRAYFERLDGARELLSGL